MEQVQVTCYPYEYETRINLLQKAVIDLLPFLTPKKLIFAKRNNMNSHSCCALRSFFFREALFEKSFGDAGE